MRAYSLDLVNTDCKPRRLSPALEQGLLIHTMSLSASHTFMDVVCYHLCTRILHPDELEDFYSALLTHYLTPPRFRKEMSIVCRVRSISDL